VDTDLTISSDRIDLFILHKSHDLSQKRFIVNTQLVYLYKLGFHIHTYLTM
jgi:hypothetical protein